MQVDGASIATGALARQLSFTVPLDLRFGLKATSLDVRGDGLRMAGDAHDVTLTSDMMTEPAGAGG